MEYDEYIFIVLHEWEQNSFRWMSPVAFHQKTRASYKTNAVIFRKYDVRQCINLLSHMKILSFDSSSKFNTFSEESNCTIPGLIHLHIYIYMYIYIYRCRRMYLEKNVCIGKVFKRNLWYHGHAWTIRCIVNIFSLCLRNNFKNFRGTW